MDNNIKDEFKDFINTLSTEICKKVLLEDLKGINESFNEISKDYDSLNNNYSNKINEIKEELIKLQNTNSKLDEFVSSVNTNNDKVNRALTLIGGTHKQIIDNIVSDNKKLFETHSKTIQGLNEIQRRKFISELIISMENQSQKYLRELDNIINKSDIGKVNDNVNAMLVKINALDSQINQLTDDMKNIEDRISTSVNKGTSDLGKQITDKLNQIKVSVESHNNYNDKQIEVLNNKIKDLNEEISKKTKTIIVLLVLCMLFLFIK